MLWKKIFISSYLLFWIAAAATSQVVNDSLKVIYGVKTTLYTTEEDIKNGRGDYHYLDTLLDDIHNFDFVSQNDNKLQDLGNLGTAIRPIWYKTPDNIGASSGFTAYNFYFKSPEKFRYYDTKSPYSNLSVLIGDKIRSIVTFDYSQNVNPNWNVGIDFSRMTVDKQVGRTTRGDRNVVSTSYSFFTHFKTKDQRYQLLGNFSRMYHTVFEIGGIKPTGEGTLEEQGLFEYENANTWLSNAESRMLMTNYHGYHQYQLLNSLSVYHSLDKTLQISYYDNFPLSAEQQSSPPYYESILVHQDTTKDRSVYKMFQTEAGVKGDVGKLYYRLYYRFREARFEYKYLNPDAYDLENYAGMHLKYTLNDSLSNLSATGEYLLAGNYKLAVSFAGKWLTTGYKRTRYKPSFLQKAYYGNHVGWYNSNLSSAVADNVHGAANIRLGFLHIKPHVSFSNVSKYIYFSNERTDTLSTKQAVVSPVQAEGTAQITAPGIDLRFQVLKYFHVNVSGTYTLISGEAADAFRIPEIFVNAKLYYERAIFKGNFYFQAGLDTHWQSAYFALDYDPITQQFFLQNDFEIPAYFKADLFVNFKISRARVFVRLTNLSMGWFDEGGYFITPYYTGQQRVFDFGVHWKFFD